MPVSKIPATAAEISVALAALFRSMPPPRGVKADDRLPGYLTALRGMSVEQVEGAIAKFLRGEVPNVSTKYCPLPPELAAIARSIGQEAEKAAKKRDYNEPFGPRGQTPFLRLWEQAGQNLARFDELMRGRPDYGQGAALAGRRKKAEDARAAPPPPREVPDYSQEKLEATPVLRKRLFDMGLVTEDELIGTEFLPTREEQKDDAQHS
jgi:hypothetical protein